jgi:hypothetical protein
MLKLIRPGDVPVVNAFLLREAREFTRDEGKVTEYIHSMTEKLDAFGDEGYDFVHIQSLTNMGQVNAELVLSPVNWDWKNGRLHLLLPPSLTGFIGKGVHPN